MYDIYELDKASLIWNRACSDDRLRDLPGDRALTDMLQAHGLTMNGGVLHAMETLYTDEVYAAFDGYRYFGFDEVADMMARARELVVRGDETGDDEKQLDAQYYLLIPDDDTTLYERFEEYLKTRPADFAKI